MEKTGNSLSSQNSFQNSIYAHGLRYLVAIGVISLAAGLRVWPLGALELRIPWVTFYPAVMAAALYGGLTPGMVATIFSGLVVLFWSPTDLPFIDDKGDLLGLAVFSVNGTLISLMSGAMHRAKKQANQARRKAETANNAKSVFLANMSHELRTPLNSILGFSRLLLKTPFSNPDQIEKLRIINNSGENLLSIINNVLDISKIEAGHMILEEEDFDLKQFLTQIQLLMSMKLRDQGVSLTLELDEKAPTRICTDATKLQQILTNLISNAIKYTPSGNITLKTTLLETLSVEKKLLQFSVCDTGVGITPQDQQTIFAPFSQAKYQTSEQEGTGLGLAICQNFVDLLGGKIALESQVGEGSTFSFAIPVAVPSERNSNNSLGFNAQDIIGLAEGQPNRRILIVEDKVENRILLRGILAPLGFELMEAANGLQALEMFDTWAPHMIFMDIRMPLLDGRGATMQIRKKPGGEKTKIVALTAHALEKEREEILAAGCDDFIRKPYLEEDIFLALAEHLGVEFAFSSRPNPFQTSSDCLESEELMADLPPSILEELKEAAILLDEDMCRKVALKIQPIDPILNRCLNRSIDDLNFQNILVNIEKSRQLEKV